MRKNIDLDEVTAKYLNASAVWQRKDLKNFIQDELRWKAYKSAVFETNHIEKKAGKYLKPLIEKVKENGIYDQKLSFEVYTEGSFVYAIRNETGYHQITVINDNMDFFDKMTIEEILESTPWFCDYVIFEIEGQLKSEKQFVFRIPDTKEFKDIFGEIY